MEEMEIRVANDATLRSELYGHLIGKEFKEQGRTRLGVVRWLSEVLMSHIKLGGSILDAAGQVMILTEDAIEEAYEISEAMEADSPRPLEVRLAWFSWNTDIKHCASRLPQRQLKEALLPRLRLIDAAQKIIDRPLADSRDCEHCVRGRVFLDERLDRLAE